MIKQRKTPKKNTLSGPLLLIGVKSTRNSLASCRAQYFGRNSRPKISTLLFFFCSLLFFFRGKRKSCKFYGYILWNSGGGRQFGSVKLFLNICYRKLPWKCTHNVDTEKYFQNLVNLDQISIVITLFHLFGSKYNCNPIMG